MVVLFTLLFSADLLGDFVDGSRFSSILEDSKFETDPYDVELHGLMTPEQYTEAIENLNKRLRRSRAGAIDGVLLATGMLVLPLVLWGARHRAQTKRRKRLLKEGIHEFNMQYQELWMRWNRRPQSTLTIESRTNQSNNYQNSQANLGLSQQEEVTHMVQATLVPDSSNGYSQPHRVTHNPQQPSPARILVQQPTNSQQVSMMSHSNLPDNLV